MSQRLDIVIFGATGFTGIRAVAEIHRIAKEDKNLTWGISGRSQSKLDKVIKELQDQTGDDLSHIKTIIADVKDPDSLTDMTQQAKVCVNCCGPYRFYGEPVVKACIETKTHHVDVSGEPMFIEGMQLDYNEAAEKAGVYIVSACGYDSIPSDMGIVYAQQHFKGKLNSAEVFACSDLAPKYRKLGAGQINYGTWESLVYILAQAGELSNLREKLSPDPKPDLSPALKARSIIHKNEIDGNWYLPFPGCDRSVVNRSQQLLAKQNNTRPIQMFAYFGFPNFLMMLIVALIGIVVGTLSGFEFGRRLLLAHPRIFSFGFISRDGPSEECMNNTTFYMNIYGEGWAEDETDIENNPPTKNIVVKVAGVNPGYGATVTALLFSGITILREADKMPGKGGVLPPGAAFANTALIDNLHKNKLTFEVVSTGDIQKA